MTTDEAAKNNGESPAAAVAEQGEDITSKKDRGVLKIVKRVGNSEETPMIGDKVYVHYKGKLSNGKKFDSSHDRNEPFVFSLGKGQVIKAWDIGVATMKKGEICHLLCKPEYAYGSAGSLPKIPSNATLFFEIELLDFKGEDLFEDGGIIRRIKRKGEGYSNPNEGATVEIHLEGRCGGRMFDCRDVGFIVGEGEDHDIPIGIDKAPLKLHNSYAVNSTDTAIVIFPKGLQIVLLTLYDPAVHNESAVVPGFVSCPFDFCSKKVQHRTRAQEDNAWRRCPLGQVQTDTDTRAVEKGVPLAAPKIHAGASNKAQKTRI